MRSRLVSRDKPIYAALIGLIESAIWIIAVAKVINDIDEPVLIAGYAIGFAAGIERLILAMDNKNKPKKIINFFIAYNNPELINQSLDIALKLRRLGLKVEIDLDNRSFAKQMKLADKSSALKTIILTIDGINNSLITVKDMKTGKEKSINIKNNFDFLIK